MNAIDKPVKRFLLLMTVDLQKSKIILVIEIKDVKQELYHVYFEKIISVVP